MLIVVNGKSHGGQGIKRFQEIQSRLPVNGSGVRVRFPTSVEESDALVQNALSDGEQCVVAAGGDGTVNGVLNALMNKDTDQPRGDVVLGGVGLGSSNDFR